jgi:hypothetical protein
MVLERQLEEEWAFYRRILRLLRLNVPVNDA